MSTIRGRFLVILGLVAASVISLVPRHVTERVPDPKTGQLKDTTVRRVPINLGLDLQGGVHLALEVDQSGTTEPVVQIVGRCRLIVELPGEKDVNRAKGIVQRTAFLEFRITDMN